MMPLLWAAVAVVAFTGLLVADRLFVPTLFAPPVDFDEHVRTALEVTDLDHDFQLWADEIRGIDQ